jgi:hypothetical protein
MMFANERASPWRERNVRSGTHIALSSQRIVYEHLKNRDRHNTRRLFINPLAIITGASSPIVCAMYLIYRYYYPIDPRSS